MLKRISFHWEFIFQRSMNGDAAKLLEILTKLAKVMGMGVLRSPLTKTLKVSLEGLREALEHQKSGTAIGKTVLLW